MAIFGIYVRFLGCTCIHRESGMFSATKEFFLVDVGKLATLWKGLMASQPTDPTQEIRPAIKLTIGFP